MSEIDLGTRTETPTSLFLIGSPFCCRCCSSSRVRSTAVGAHCHSVKSVCAFHRAVKPKFPLPVGWILVANTATLRRLLLLFSFPPSSVDAEMELTCESFIGTAAQVSGPSGFSRWMMFVQTCATIFCAGRKWSSGSNSSSSIENRSGACLDWWEPKGGERAWKVAILSSEEVRGRKEVRLCKKKEQWVDKERREKEEPHLRGQGVRHTPKKEWEQLSLVRTNRSVFGSVATGHNKRK